MAIDFKNDLAIFDNTKLVEFLIKKESLFLPKLREVFVFAREILDNRITETFPKFTLHNTKHSIHIMGYMYELIEDIEKVSELDVVILIYSAILHDIGMGVFNDIQKEEIKKDTHPLIKGKLKYSAVLKDFEGNANLALQEIIRRFHAEKSAEFIRNTNEIYEKLIIPTKPLYTFSETIAKICLSHTKDFDWIKNNLKPKDELGQYQYNPQYCACLLRLGDILDIDAERTPYNLYQLIKPIGLSDEEWKQHRIVKNTHKIKKSNEVGVKKIHLIGSCTDATIHRKFMTYVDWINKELYETLKQKSKWDSKIYGFNFSYPIEVEVETKGYSIPDFKMELDYRTVTSLLMGTNIYGDKKYGLRELIQNSLDACNTRLAIENQKNGLGDFEYRPEIRIIADSIKNTLTIKDNGIGMNREIIKNHFLRVGHSYYSSQSFRYKGLDFNPIGYFGIGFLACFMLSNRVTVRTRHIDSNLLFELELENGSEFLSLKENNANNFYGTEIILNFKEFMSAMGSNNIISVKTFLEKNFIFENIEVNLINAQSKKTSIKSNHNLHGYDLNTGLKEIDLSRFLNKTQGSVIIHLKNRTLQDLSALRLINAPHFYYSEESNSLIDMEESSRKMPLLYELIKNNKLHYSILQVIDYENEQDFLDQLEIDKKPEDAFDNMSSKKYITVLAKPHLIEQIYSGVYNDWTNIMGQFTTELLSEINYFSHHGTSIMKRELSIFTNSDKTTYLPYFHETDNNSINSLFPKLPKSYNINCFIRNVLVQKYSLEIPLASSSIEIKTLWINVLNNKIKPNISRNALNPTDSENLSYALNKAIHLGVLENLKSNFKEKIIHEEFIHEFFSKKSILES